jgi:molecular chaperone GrpE
MTKHHVDHDKQEHQAKAEEIPVVHPFVAPSEAPLETPTEAQSAAEAVVKALMARSEELEAEAAKYKDQALRAMAESENTRRRLERDAEERTKYAIANFARDLLNTADNLRRAIESVPAAAMEGNETAKNLLVGVEMTERGLLTAFEKFNIKLVAAQGARFDANLHQAMFELEDPNQPAGLVVQVLQSGYVIHDRLLRPAMVAVSKGGPKLPPEAQPEPIPTASPRVDTEA